MENWKGVVGFEDLYEVSDHGRVRTIKTGRIKVPTAEKKSGRLAVMLSGRDKPRLMRVHRMVLLAFVGPAPKGHECCHNDGNPSHNHISNLRWDTTAANQADRVRHGTSNRGERCAAAKLSEAQVRAIKADPRLQRIIAKEYGVRENTISRIKSGVRWAHVA